MTYLDYAATTPLDPRVRDAMVRALDVLPGNPSSLHNRSGREAKNAIDGARRSVASLLGVSRADVVFTSGATEALTLGIVGTCLGLPPERRRIVIGASEHKAALAAASLAQALSGADVAVCPVDSDGVLQQDALVELMQARPTGLIVAMYVNNETGAVSPIEAISRVCHEAGALLMCDVSQALGKVAVDFAVLGADLMACSAHKFYGPKGVGALSASREVRSRLVPLAPGGGQQAGLRGGTENVPAIVGMGVAAAIAEEEAASDSDLATSLGELFWRQFLARVAGVRRLGRDDHRLPSMISMYVPGANAEEVMAELDDIEISAGSACSSGTPQPSHVLAAMGLSPGAAEQCLRVSVGRFTTQQDIEIAVEGISRAVEAVRNRHSGRGAA